MAKNYTIDNQDSNVQDLLQRLQEAEDTLEAIRSGAIDAIVVEGEEQQQIFTLKSADYTYRMLIESMSQGAVTISEDGVVLYSNKQFSKMMNVPLEQIIGSKIQQYFASHDKEHVIQLIEDPDIVDQELTVEINCTPYLAVMISATKLPAQDSIAYMYMVITDMTERKKAEDAKDEFISLASHQLRTPATGVKQYLGMLLEGYAGKLSEKNRFFIKTAYDSNERELHIINDILKTAQIDSGLFKLNKSHQNLAVITKNAVSKFRPIFDVRKQKVLLDLEENVTALMDPGEIELAVINIIENASKYSPQDKEIIIKVFRKPNAVCVAVIDHGVGIAESDKLRIFDKFTRIDNPLSDTINGSGLGLYWVRRIIKMHDGDIELTSSLSEGSTFTICLPA
jgi:PAS domain S-box-containing protein